MTIKKPYLAPTRKVIILGMLFAVVSFNLNAAPVTLNLIGTVTDAAGSRTAAGDLGTSVTTNLVFDLDPNNAIAYVFEPADGDNLASATWYFDTATYSSTTRGNFGTLNGAMVTVETVDDFETDTLGNPFGLTGIVDVLSIWGGDLSVDCTGGTVDPITGCSLKNSPVIGGVEFSVNLIYHSNWFNGLGENDLPSSIPDFPELIGIFGNTFFAEGGDFIGQNEVTYQPLKVSAVPIPAAAWLFGTALLGFVGISRRRNLA